MIVGALLVGGCKPDATAGPVTKTATATASATGSSPSPFPSSSSSPFPSSSQSVSEGLDGGVRTGAEPNLLDVVPATIAVSSAVHNPRDFPEHLIDGKSDTAWNGRTGELVGGWIAFRVPKDAHVLRLEMTAGFDKVKGSLDLFTANHRITKVTVQRDGVRIGDFPLDPNVRTLQTIPIDRPGGEYTITVAATLPGTKKEWKELAVSELRVVGTPGTERRTEKEPHRVLVGSLDAEPGPLLEMENAPVPEAHRDLAALCKAFAKDVEATKSEHEETAKNHGLKLSPPTCAATAFSTAFTGDAAYKRVLAVRTFDGIQTETALVVEVPRGLVLAPISWSHDDPLDPGCPSIVRMDRVKSLRVENGHLVAVMSGTTTSFGMDGRAFSVGVDGATWCKDAGGKLACKTYMPQYNGDIGAFSIAPDGTIRQQGSR